jgi:hypothetical protein
MRLNLIIPMTRLLGLKSINQRIPKILIGAVIVCPKEFKWVALHLTKN